MEPDWSTINLQWARSHLPAYKLPPTYHLGDMGNMCYLDAPGYPSYFVRSVYTSYGNTPTRGPQQVIQLPDGSIRVVLSEKDYNTFATAETCRKSVEWRLRRLWKPLPIEHPRVKAWMMHVYRHFNGCFTTPLTRTIQVGFFTNEEIPSIVRALGLASELHPDMADYAVRAVFDPSVHDAFLLYWKELCTTVASLTYTPVVHIREFYVEFDPNVHEHDSEDTGSWWETFSYRPSPDECPGNHRYSCQICGIIVGKE